MQLPTFLCLAYVASAVALPRQLFGRDKPKHKPVAFFLAGDSTTATNGGWGDAFLPLLSNNATGINYGHGGATTVSFVAGGDWASVINSVKEHRNDYHPYVTIQVCKLVPLPSKRSMKKILTRGYKFGHNDQKEAANISIARFEENLTRFVSDVRLAGGTPILVTSLTRRGFSGGKVIENLVPQVNATLKVASETKAAVVDLNKASTKYVNAIGSTNADLYNLKPGDRTHLNWSGGVVFANLVSSLIEGSEVGKKVRKYIQLNETIIAAIENGQFILPLNETTTA